MGHAFLCVAILTVMPSCKPRVQLNADEEQATMAGQRKFSFAIPREQIAPNEPDISRSEPNFRWDETNSMLVFHGTGEEHGDELTFSTKLGPKTCEIVGSKNPSLTTRFAHGECYFALRGRSRESEEIFDARIILHPRNAMGRACHRWLYEWREKPRHMIKSCRLGIEECSVPDHGELPSKVVFGCGGGIVRYRNFLCEHSPHVDEETLNNVMCSDVLPPIPEVPSLPFSFGKNETSACQEWSEQPRPLAAMYCGNSQGPSSFCFVAGYPSYPGKDVGPCMETTSYQDYLCSKWPDLTREILASVVCSSFGYTGDIPSPCADSQCGRTPTTTSTETETITSSGTSEFSDTATNTYAE